jgi:hypothetical protein
VNSATGCFDARRWVGVLAFLCVEAWLASLVVFQRVLRRCINGLPHWMFPNLLCHGAFLLNAYLLEDRWIKLTGSHQGWWPTNGCLHLGLAWIFTSSRRWRVCALSCIGLPAWECVLFYMQCMSCCWSLFLLERSGGPMTVCLKLSYSVRVYHRGCTCQGDVVGFYFLLLRGFFLTFDTVMGCDPCIHPPRGGPWCLMVLPALDELALSW